MNVVFLCICWMVDLREDYHGVKGPLFIYWTQRSPDHLQLTACEKFHSPLETVSIPAKSVALFESIEFCNELLSNFERIASSLLACVTDLFSLHAG